MPAHVTTPPKAPDAIRGMPSVTLDTLKANPELTLLNVQNGIDVQVLDKRGHVMAVMIPKAEYERLKAFDGGGKSLQLPSDKDTSDE